MIPSAMRFSITSTLLVLALGILASAASAQNSSGNSLYDQGLDLQEKAEYKRSSEHFKKAAAAFEASQSWSQLAKSYNELSFNARFQNELKQAQEFAEYVLTLDKQHQTVAPREVANAYHNLGTVAAQQGNPKAALKQLKKGLAVAQNQKIAPSLRANIIASLGSAYQDLGNYEQALAEFQRGLRLLNPDISAHQKPLATLYNYMGVNFVSAGDLDRGLSFYQKELALLKEMYGDGHPDVAGVYNNMGGVSYRSGDIGQAVDYFKKAAQSFEKAFGTNHPSVAMTYNNLGASYFQMNELEQAIRYLEKSAEIKEAVQGPDHPDLAPSYNNIGGLYLELERYEEAKQNLQEALRIRKEALGPNHPKLTNTYSTLGNLFLEQQQPDSAISYFEREVAITQKQRGPDHPYVADALNNIAKSYAEQAFYERALSYHQQALQVLGDDFEADRRAENPKVNGLRYPNYAVRILGDKSRTLQKTYEQHGDLSKLEAALATVQRLSELIDFLQVSFRSEQSKLMISEQSHEMYELGIEVAHKLHQETGQATYLEQAFYFAEKSKTRVILERINAQQAKKFAGVPDSLITHEQQLRKDIAQLREKLRRSIDEQGQSHQTYQLRDSVFTLSQSLHDHQRLLERRYPRYHNLKYNQQIPSVSEIQQKLRQQDLSLIEYFHGSSATWGFVVNGTDLSIHKLPHDSTLHQQVWEFREAIAQQSNETYVQLGSSLYQKLMQPLMGAVTNSDILIIPDGVMNLLPFEALLTEEVTPSQDDINFAELPYVINDVTSSYSPSISMSSLFRDSESQRYSQSFAAFAPVFNFSASSIQRRQGRADGQWSPLPSTKLEVQQIAELFDDGRSLWEMVFGDPDAPDLFMEDVATEGNFKQRDLSRYKYLHLATHAFAGDSATSRSGIVFHQQDRSDEDDILYADEIYTLNLQNELLVLSACETGSGKVVKGEGIIGLSRAFQYAGVDNLLVSLWKVDDRSTAKLMIDFYRQTLDGDSFDGSLRSAKQQLIATSTYAHPQYWAPFVLLGQ